MSFERRRYDSGSPLQEGNALKNKNFDKIVFRVLFITIIILMMVTGCIHYLPHILVR
jgi:hypothetical protein